MQRLCLRIAEHHKRRDCLLRVVDTAGNGGCRHRRRCRCGLQLLLAHLVAQLKYNALCNLLADARRLHEHFFIAGDNAERQSVRRCDRQDGQRRLRANTVNAGQHQEAGLLLLVDKAIQLKHALTDIEPGQQTRFFAGFQLADGVLRSVAGIAYTAAVDHRKTLLEHGNRAVYIIKHLFKPHNKPS